MNDIEQLNKYYKKVSTASDEIRGFISELVDVQSFVETDLFFSGNSSNNNNVAFENVITGYATINDKKVCILAQNSKVLGGGLTKAHADKIVRCIKRSINSKIPLISIIDSVGAVLNERIDILEGYAQIISTLSELRNYAPHIAVIKGNAIGLMGMYATISDFIFMSNNAVLSAQSPLSLAENIDDAPESYLGKDNFIKDSLLSTLTYNDTKDLRKNIKKTFKITDGELSGEEDDPNRTSNILNSVINSENLINALLDKTSKIEMFAEYTSNIKSVLGTINTLPVGILVTNASKLNEKAIKKAIAFVKFLNTYKIPLITLVDNQGLEANLIAEQQGFINECAELIQTINKSDIPKISVATNYAIGYSYVALISKATGFNYAYAFPNAKIAPIMPEAAPNILYREELVNEKDDITKKRAELVERYKKEIMNPYLSAHSGYIDNIIEPALLRPYIASTLLMLSNKENQ